MSELAKRKLGDILVERGFITEEQLQEALRSGKRLGEALMEMGALSADELNWALSELLGVPYVEFRDEMVDFDLARTMPEEVLRRHSAFPVLQVGNELTVILSDPTNRHAVIELEALTGAKVSVAIAAGETIRHLLDKAFPLDVRTPGRVPFAEIGAGGTEADASGWAQVYSLLVGALRAEATELHLEPIGQEVRVRSRVNGRLVEQARTPRSALATAISRLRATAGLRGASLPCQAYLRTRVEGQDLELDVLLLPTLYGDALTMRIWRARTEVPTLETLEVSGPARDELRHLTEGAGLVVVTGRDPRARSALLYALAQAAADGTKRVMTVERVVSFIVPDFVQVQLPADAEDGAATVLTHPGDVALVEDLGQAATCLAAIGGVEQGALVLGGLHAASGASGLARLLGLALPHGSLLGVIRGVASVERHGSRHEVEVLSMTDELRQELLTRGQGPWTSRTS
ncbi:MAG: ATPase, T2SS/T4P/T4SS family [Candidatus Rokuibacteriota bacterium]